MESRRNKVDALQDSLRNEQGENWKSDNLQVSAIIILWM